MSVRVCSQVKKLNPRKAYICGQGPTVSSLASSGVFAVIKNESKIFLKIPTVTESIPVLVWNDYCRYLIFKSMDREGYIETPKGPDRSTYNNWMRKMVDRGWACKRPEGGYQLRSYQHVWQSMGVVKTIRERVKKKGYQYTKIWEHKTLPLSPSDYKGLVGQIRLQLANRKIRQIKHRLVRGRGIDLNNKSLVKRTALDVAFKEKPMLSCKRVAKLFGYKSTSSVWEDYGFYFSKVTQKKKIVLSYDDDMKRTFKTPCNRIHLFESKGNV